MERIIAAAGLKGCELERMTNSYSNEVYRAGDTFLKLFRSERKWQVDRDLPPLLAAHGLPVTTILRCGQVEDRYWLLCTALPGVNLEEVIDRAPASAYYAAGRLLASLHEITYPCYGRIGPDRLYETFTDWGAHFRDRLERFLVHPHVVPHLNPAERAEARRFFERYSDALRGGHPCIVHRDYRPGNLLVDPRTFAITGLLDFEAVQVGDPGVDFAKVETEYFRQRPDLRGEFLAGYGSVRGLPDLREVRVHDLINSIGGIGWAGEYGDMPFLERNLAHTRALLAEG